MNFLVPQGFLGICFQRSHGFMAPFSFPLCKAPLGILGVLGSPRFLASVGSASLGHGPPLWAGAGLGLALALAGLGFRPDFGSILSLAWIWLGFGGIWLLAFIY